MGYIAATITYNGRTKTADSNSLVPEKKSIPDWLPWLVLGGLVLGGGATAVKMRNEYVRDMTRHYRNRNIAGALLGLLGIGGAAAAAGAFGNAAPNRDRLTDTPAALDSAATRTAAPGNVGGGALRDMFHTVAERPDAAHNLLTSTVSSAGRMVPGRINVDEIIANLPGRNRGGLSGLAERAWSPNILDNAWTNPFGVFRDRPSWTNPLGLDVFNSNQRY